MTDISVIKMIISAAVWRIYPSWVNDKLRAWEGLGHSRMFWARLSRDDFRSKLEIISFLSGVTSVWESFFVSRAFETFGAKPSSSGAFGFDDVLEVSLKTPLRHRAFFASSDYDHEYFWQFPFLFSKAEPMLLDWQLWWSPGWAKHFSDGTSKTRMKTWLPRDGEIIRRRIIDRGRDWYESCAVIHGPKKKKKKGSQRVIGPSLNPSSSDKPVSFEEPVSETRCRYRFALRCCRVRGYTAVGRSGCSAGKAKKSSHLWHFPCRSPRRNELECTDLVHWTGAYALHHFSSRDAIIVVGSVLEKHFEFDGDFTPDQEKEIIFKRWPLWYQSWKPGMALNGLRNLCEKKKCLNISRITVNQWPQQNHLIYH